MTFANAGVQTNARGKIPAAPASITAADDTNLHDYYHNVLVN